MTGWTKRLRDVRKRVLFTELDDSETSTVKERLEEHGVKRTPIEEDWSRDEAEEFDPF
ncbi:MAG: hypothetical protein ACW99J_07140 [Candidatus Thorarchaeota archaeon]